MIPYWQLGLPGHQHLTSLTDLFSIEMTLVHKQLPLLPQCFHTLSICGNAVFGQLMALQQSVDTGQILSLTANMTVYSTIFTVLQDLAIINIPVLLRLKKMLLFQSKPSHLQWPCSTAGLSKLRSVSLSSPGLPHRESPMTQRVVQHAQ